MISYEDIRELHKHQAGADHMFLSMYVNVDQSNASNLNRGFETVVENEIRQMAERQNSNNNGRQRLQAECDRVLHFLKNYTPKGLGLVIFSDSTHGVWWQRELHVEVATRVRWSTYPWVRPLLEVIEQHDPFVVVLIDKQQARILTVDASGMQQHSEISSDVPNKHATTGTDHIWSQGQMDRDHVNHIKLHGKRVADELAGVIERLKLSRVVIGGPVEATSLFANELPKRVQQMIIGTISAPVDADHHRLLSDIREVQERAEHEDEAKLVESMITSAMKGAGAVLGISDTLAAIHQGRVHCMVVARDFHPAGQQCTSCQVLLVDGVSECSFCAGKLEPAPDLINRASHKVLDQAGKVQTVSGSAAHRLADTGVGAVLRF